MVKRRTRTRTIVLAMLLVVVLVAGTAWRRRRGDEWTIVARGEEINKFPNGRDRSWWAQAAADVVGAPSDKEALDDDLDRLERSDKLPLPYRLNRTKEVSGIRPLLRPYDLAHLPSELEQALNRFISAPHLQLTTSNVVFPNTDFSIQVHDDSAVAVALRGDIVETEVTTGDRRYIETHPVAGGESRYAIVRRSDPSVVGYQEWLYAFLDVASSTGFEQQISSGMTTWTSYSGSFVTVNGELKSFVSVHSSSSPSTWEVKILQPGEVGDVPVETTVPAWAISKPLMPVSALAR